MKKFVLVIVLFISMFSLTGCGKEKLETKENLDLIKFKEEYEALNGTKNSSGKEYRVLSISEDNPFVYTTGENLVEKIENNDTFYVYFGSPYCPWCRSVIEKAIEVAKEKGIDTIYYVDIWDKDHVEILRDTYKLNDNGEPELVSDGSKSYKDLLKYFDNVLSDYTLTDKDGNKVLVGEKRIFAPSFIFVKNGLADSIVTGISEKQTDFFSKLTEEMLKDEKTIFQEFFK